MSGNLNLQNLGSLITYTDKEGVSRCLGNLLFHEGKAYDPDHGAIELSKEHTDAHNKAFDTALIEGLDKAEVGQGANFYFVNKQVKTWLGTVVDEFPQYHRGSIVVNRKGKVFTGKLKKGEVFFLRRLS